MTAVDEKPKFSILIVAYKSSNDLDRLFDCLDAQTNREFETILIDNASPEFAPNKSQIARADIFIQNTENTGFARANNQAAKLANGEFLVLLNPDAFPNEDWLFEIDKGITTHPDCDCFGSLQLLDGEKGLLDGAGDCFSIYGIAWRGGHRKPIPSNLKDGEIFSACAAAAVWKKTRFTQLSGFEEGFNSYYEDVDLGFRHRLLGGNCILLSRAIVSHRGSASSSRYSDYAVFHGIRNRELAYFRLVPGIWVWVLFLPHLAWVLLLWAHAFYRGAGVSYSKGIFAALKSLPRAFKERQLIQKSAISGFFDLLPIMALSPFRLLNRSIILKEILKK